MEADARPPSTDGSLEAGLRELRDAIELREAEHARRNGNRVLFSRGVLLFFLGIFAGLLILGRGFDTQVYKDRLYQRLQAGAPAVVHQLRSALTELQPVYEAEVAKSMPQFNQNVTTLINSEASRVNDGLVPLLSGDLLPLTDRADQELAKRLLKEFGPELNNDPKTALEVARAIRSEELKAGRTAAAKDFGGAFSTLDDIGASLRMMGPPPPEGFNSPEIVSSLGVAAMDAVKTKLMSGEMGFGADDKAGKNKIGGN